MGAKGDKLREVAALADQEEELVEEQRRLTDELKRSWLSDQPVSNHFDIEKKFAVENKVSLSDAKKQLNEDFKKYEVEGKDIPSLIKELKNYRRTLKGEEKVKITQSIDNLIKGYASHLDETIEKIYWLAKYKPVVKEMVCSEEQLIKLSYIHDENTRREALDSLCKYWEARLDREESPYNSRYSSLTKEMTNSKKEFKKIIKEHMPSIGPKDIIKQEILHAVCEEPGISARQIHERLPKNLFKKTSPSIISKMARTQNITTVDGAFYKFSDDIKKDIYAYTAAFIDSDGYITMDKNFNPRVGLVATGDRGKAFMLEMHKSLGCGRLHLDQKSPQDTKPVNRLNFYSAADVNEILTKCRPFLKMKGTNADILLELLRMKKSHKKADWYKPRREELFQLMKYENHKDNTNYDFAKYGIDIETVSKFHDNSKMTEMDVIEGVIKGADEAIDDLEEIAEEHDLSEDEWSSVDDASDYLFEHKVLEDE